MTDDAKQAVERLGTMLHERYSDTNGSEMDEEDSDISLVLSALESAERERDEARSKERTMDKVERAYQKLKEAMNNIPNHAHPQGWGDVVVACRAYVAALPAPPKGEHE